jgi:hypothetical protein
MNPLLVLFVIPGRAYWAVARARPVSLLACATLAQLALFSLAPKMRPLCFR